MAATSGITSERYLQGYAIRRHVRMAIISLGVNDGEGTATQDNLSRLRARVKADTVYWLLTGGNPHAREAVRSVARRFGDRLLDAAPLAGADRIHPDRAGYARLAAAARGAGGGSSSPAYRDFVAPTTAYRAFPAMPIKTSPYKLNGVAVNGARRPW